jgi:hypothetical protein
MNLPESIKNDLEFKTLWPSLQYEEWKDSYDTLHMWMQIVGKVKLALNPFINQWWHITFQITASGLTTGLIPYKNEVFEINFNFINHNLYIHTSSGQLKTISLRPRSVADFYKEFMETLHELDIKVKVNTLPSEVPDPIHFDSNNINSSYDNEYVYRWWFTMVHLWPIFEKFRSSFRGKSSPVHFFWGSFDLNVTRFSGSTCPPPAKDRIMFFSENEENFSYGFWPGDSRYTMPAFYSYMYPAPNGIEKAKIKPAIASFNNNLGEFILPYEEVRKSTSPEDMITQFLHSTYNESARLAGWNIKSLECLNP